MKNHPRKWVSDPLNNILYHAHFYFDRSGRYENPHAVELAAAKSQGYASVGDMGVARVKKFTDWVAEQGVQGFIGEFGWPNSVKRPEDSAAWNADSWTFEALEAHYRTLVRYLDLDDQGTVLGGGCGTLSMTKRSRYPKLAYELGRRL